MNILTALQGMKTYIVGALLIVVGLLDLVGITIPEFGGPDAGLIISGGLGMIFIRAGINNAVTAAIIALTQHLGKK